MDAGKGCEHDSMDVEGRAAGAVAEGCGSLAGMYGVTDKLKDFQLDGFNIIISWYSENG